MGASSRIRFEPRWKEELVCTLNDRSVVIELTMGTLTVYLPSERKWEASAPEWAKRDWGRFREELAAWCAQQNIPLQIDDGAWVSEG